MTREQFTKYKFRHSEEIVFEISGKTDRIHCMLIGIDFEQGLLQLIPIFGNYDKEKFWSRCEYCTKALTIKKINTSKNG